MDNVTGFLSDGIRDAIAIAGLALSLLTLVLASGRSQSATASSPLGPGVIAVFWAANVRNRFVPILILLAVILIALLLQLRPPGDIFARAVIAAYVRNFVLGVAAIFIGAWYEERHPALLRRFWILVWTVPSMLLMAIIAGRFLIPGLPGWAQHLADVEMIGLVLTIVVALVIHAVARFA